VTIPRNEAPPAPSSPSGVPAQAETNSVKITKTPLEEALERARNFNGTKNSDWTPYIHTFDGVEMCLVPCGKFMMGSDVNEDEQPVHEQSFLKPFWIDKYPVTNAEYKRAEDTGFCKVPEYTRWYHDKEFANHPVVGVTWHQAVSYAKWRSSLSGVLYHLPTEREWEYVARGVSNLIYPWGNEFISENLVYAKNSRDHTNEITSRYGGESWVSALHLSGNVWEWCSDIYEPYASENKHVSLNRKAVLRILRGGSWIDDDSGDCRASFRYGGLAGGSSLNFGFRLALPM
jgi:formylglycine-generating enzyme required for sulfatase activity